MLKLLEAINHEVEMGTLSRDTSLRSFRFTNGVCDVDLGPYDKVQVFHYGEAKADTVFNMVSFANISDEDFLVAFYSDPKHIDVRIWTGDQFYFTSQSNKVNVRYFKELCKQAGFKKYELVRED